MECEKEVVRFKALTKQPFRGKIYVKGEFTNPKCIRNYGLTPTQKRDDQGGEKVPDGNLCLIG